MSSYKTIISQLFQGIWLRKYIENIENYRQNTKEGGLFVSF